VITKNIEQDALAVGRAYQVDKPGWAKKRRNLAQENATENKVKK
jgi:bifunctional N-acetylglucosamine-1-phosphate-uridyltransferase/glucosamine-1-phosphate-acetyltransferase GlmU-like protein